MCDYVFRLLILGESTVGKTAILFRYLGKGFHETISTIGVEFNPKIIDLLQRKVKLVIYDTSGQERYKSIVNNYYKNTHGIIFVYDITKKKSLDLVEYWINQAKENSDIDLKCCVLFGNKTDLGLQRAISQEEGESFANKYGLGFMEGSALKGENIKECFHEIAKKILDKTEQVNESFNDSIQFDRVLENNKAKSRKIKNMKLDFSKETSTKKKQCCK